MQARSGRCDPVADHDSTNRKRGGRPLSGTTRASVHTRTRTRSLTYDSPVPPSTPSARGFDGKSHDFVGEGADGGDHPYPRPPPVHRQCFLKKATATNRDAAHQSSNHSLIEGVLTSCPQRGRGSGPVLDFRLTNVRFSKPPDCWLRIGRSSSNSKSTSTDTVLYLHP